MEKGDGRVNCNDCGMGHYDGSISFGIHVPIYLPTNGAAPSSRKNIDIAKKDDIDNNPEKQEL